VALFRFACVLPFVICSIFRKNFLFGFRLSTAIWLTLNTTYIQRYSRNCWPFDFQPDAFFMVELVTWSVTLSFDMTHTNIISKLYSPIEACKQQRWWNLTSNVTHTPLLFLHAPCVPDQTPYFSTFSCDVFLRSKHVTWSTFKTTYIKRTFRKEKVWLSTFNRDAFFRVEHVTWALTSSQKLYSPATSGTLEFKPQNPPSGLNLSRDQ
jgi:hypothetical protein